jgi:hypothetical protein
VSGNLCWLSKAVQGKREKERDAVDTEILNGYPKRYSHDGGGKRCPKANNQTSSAIKSEVINMYQIYSLVSIIVSLWGITIWASIPEEEEERR